MSLVTATEPDIVADVIFVIEGTAINGAYLNEIKTNYIIPTLEYFSQGMIDERDYVPEGTSSLYGVVIYQASDCMPAPNCTTFGPYSSPQRLLTTLERMELAGGKGESHAHIAEGLATALMCFEELQVIRDGNTNVQKHCIIICNSPPYQIPVMECHNFSNKTVEQLATILQENLVNLSIFSPRKILPLFKLFEKAGGDLSSCQTKNYAKDPRHLVLLKGYSLKERPVSPSGTATNGVQLPPNLSSPLPPTDSPMGGGSTTASQNIIPPTQTTQNTVFRPNQANGGINQMQGQTGIQGQSGMQGQTGMPAPIGGPARPGGHMIGQGFVGPQTGGPPGYLSANSIQRPANPRNWMMPPHSRPTYMSGPQQQTQGQNSALLSQLSTPPHPMGAPGAPVGVNNSVLNNQQQNNMNTQQQNNMNTQQQAMRIQMLSQNNVPTVNPGQPQNTLGPQQQNMNTQQTQNPQVQQPGQTPNVAPAANQAPANQPIRERHTIWHGVLEWIEKAKSDQPKHTRHVPCQVSANSKDGEPELNAESWPQKLIMQLMPKQLIGNIGGQYLRDSKSVLFHPQNCEALESLTKVMSSGFAGCVHFTSTVPLCDIKVLILLYTSEKKAYLGFIPNNQAAFVDRLRKVIQQQKQSPVTLRGQAANAPGGPGNIVPGTSGVNQNQMSGPSLGNAPGQTPTSQPPNSQSGIMMSQTNTMAMGGGQITQNVITSSVGSSGGIGSLGAQGTPPRMGLPNMPSGNNNPGASTAQQNQQGQNMIGAGPSNRPAYHIEAARQQNLEKILQLKQSLELAQHQDAQYKTQLEIYNHPYNTPHIQQIQDNLQMAQNKEAQFKQQLELQALQQLNQQRGMNNNQGQGNPGQMGNAPTSMSTGIAGTGAGMPVAAGVQQNAGAQRIMRPGMASNPGLRHLLQQQQQPQYRQQMMNMGPRSQNMGGQINSNPPQNNSQPFDDGSTFDFI